MLAATNSHALWYLTRATGLVSLLLLTGSVVLGIIGVKRWSSRHWPRFVTGGLHKNVSLLAVAFLAVHVVTAVTDSFVTITWLNVFVPFTGTYRPVWLGLGAVAGDLLIALIITSLARAIHRLPGLACGALGRLRVLADRFGPRARDGHRCPPWLGAGDVARLARRSCAPPPGGGSSSGAQRADRRPAAGCQQTAPNRGSSSTDRGPRLVASGKGRR